MGGVRVLLDKTPVNEKEVEDEEEDPCDEGNCDCEDKTLKNVSDNNIATELASKTKALLEI